MKSVAMPFLVSVLVLAVGATSPTRYDAVLRAIVAWMVWTAAALSIGGHAQDFADRIFDATGLVTIVGVGLIGSLGFSAFRRIRASSK